MKKTNGYLLLFLGLLHVAVGVVGGWSQFVFIADYGIWNALIQHSQAVCMKTLGCLQLNGTWWFVAWGLMLILFGLLCTWVEVILNQTVPAFIAWLLCLICVVCAILMPASGFWLVMIVALNMFLCARKKHVE